MALASAITRIGTAVEVATDKIFVPADRDAVFKGEPPPARMRGKIHMGNGIKLTVAWVLPSGRSLLRSHPPKSLTLADSPAEALVVNPGSRAAGGCSSRAPGLRCPSPQPLSEDEEDARPAALPPPPLDAVAVDGSISFKNGPTWALAPEGVQTCYHSEDMAEAGRREMPAAKLLWKQGGGGHDARQGTGRVLHSLVRGRI